tara:strand:- start:392 stop:697 length:306 start_codon:yes stop_codon:yes gene_type:complete
MNRKHVEKWIEARFGLYDESYAQQWRDRFAGLECETQIPWQMDVQSRKVWGRVTGNRYGLIKYNYDVNPVFAVVDLHTGLVVGTTEQQLTPTIDDSMPEEG